LIVTTSTTRIKMRACVAGMSDEFPID
jgi:hypothetical protein